MSLNHRFKIPALTSGWVPCFALVLGALYAAPLLAGTEEIDDFRVWGLMATKLLGGLALFLYGLEQMGDALKAATGERLKLILARLTTNRYTGVATGALIAAMVQSSSVPTVLVVGFISAGFMSLAQSVSVIMGANIGNTVIAQIVAFKVNEAALLMVAAGFGMLFIARQDRIKQYGATLMGLGLIFFGVSIMSDGLMPLRSHQPFLELMAQLEDPVLAIFIAATFTALIRSSPAATSIVIVLASQGFLTLLAGLALVLGANIGTCVTTLLSSVGKQREALRAAAVHVLLNVVGVLIWVMFIQQLADFVTWLSPATPGLTGVERLAAETPRQIANAYTIFNIANAILFIWFTGQIAHLVQVLIPDSALEEEGLLVSAKYLDEELLSASALALDRVRLEVLHVGARVQEMVERIMPAVLNGDRESLAAIRAMDDEVDIIYEQIIDYMGKISQQNLSDEQTSEFLKLMEAVNDLENIGDTIETNLVDLGYARIESGIVISIPTAKVLGDFHEVVTKAVASAIHAVSENSEEIARSVISMKQEVAEMADSATSHQAQRLVVEQPNRIPAYTIEIDIIEKQKRIYYFAKRMAKSVILEEIDE